MKEKPKKKRGRPRKGREKGSSAVFVVLSKESKRMLMEWRKNLGQPYAKSIDQCIQIAAGRIPE